MATVSNTSQSQKTISVAATTLANIIEEHALPQIDFLKLDCEGSEYGIIYGLPANHLIQIRAICIETHPGAQPNENTLALCDYLQSRDFRLNYHDQKEAGYIWAWQAH